MYVCDILVTVLICKCLMSCPFLSVHFTENLVNIIEQNPTTNQFHASDNHLYLKEVSLLLFPHIYVCLLKWMNENLRHVGDP